MGKSALTFYVDNCPNDLIAYPWITSFPYNFVPFLVWITASNFSDTVSIVVAGNLAQSLTGPHNLPMPVPSRFFSLEAWFSFPSVKLIVPIQHCVQFLLARYHAFTWTALNRFIHKPSWDGVTLPRHTFPSVKCLFHVDNPTAKPCNSLPY